MITNIFWYICKAKSNMGDLIAPYIFEQITGQQPRRVMPNTSSPFFLSCGSIIGSCNSNAIVWGTGSMFPNVNIRKPLKMLSVRGPLTRKALLAKGINCPEVYGDPGLLLPHFYTPIVDDRHYKVGVIAHYADHEYISKIFSNIPDILVIDINRPVELVCNDIKACEITVSSSLHGIIVSHAYDVPSAWMLVSKYTKYPIGGGRFKYDDYFQSRDMEKTTALVVDSLPRKADELYNLLEQFPQPNNTVDIQQLLDCCPFGKTVEEILA